MGRRANETIGTYGFVGTPSTGARMRILSEGRAALDLRRAAGDVLRHLGQLLVAVEVTPSRSSPSPGGALSDGSRAPPGGALVHPLTARRAFRPASCWTKDQLRGLSHTQCPPSPAGRVRTGRPQGAGVTSVDLSSPGAAHDRFIRGPTLQAPHVGRNGSPRSDAERAHRHRRPRPVGRRFAGNDRVGQPRFGRADFPRTIAPRCRVRRAPVERPDLVRNGRPDACASGGDRE